MFLEGCNLYGVLREMQPLMRSLRDGTPKGFLRGTATSKSFLEGCNL
jgi:hypothetical protein